MRNKKGFTMVELLVVLIIVAILAAVATPIYLANARRARVSEAVATMSLIRQAMRDYRINHESYYDVASGDISNPGPTSVVVASGVPTPSTAGVNIDVGVAQYFSNDAFTVQTGTGMDTDGASGLFTNPGVVDFLISVDGDASDACVAVGSDDCAINNTDVVDINVEMDNSGRIFVTYDEGTTWEAY